MDLSHNNKRYKLPVLLFSVAVAMSSVAYGADWKVVLTVKQMACNQSDQWGSNDLFPTGNFFLPMMQSFGGPYLQVEDKNKVNCHHVFTANVTGDEPTITITLQMLDCDGAFPNDQIDIDPSGNQHVTMQFRPATCELHIDGVHAPGEFIGAGGTFVSEGNPGLGGDGGQTDSYRSTATRGKLL